MVFAPKWDEEGALKAVKGASEAGFDIIEIPLMHPEIDCELTVRLLEEYGLTPTCSLGLSHDNGTLCFLHSADHAFFRIQSTNSTVICALRIHSTQRYILRRRRGQ